MKPFDLHQEDFEWLARDCAGFCSKCMGVSTESGVEPDAKGYDCPVCETKSLMGMEEALLQGLIRITEEEK